LSHLLAPLPALDHHRYSCLPLLRQVSYLGTYFPSLGTYFSVPSHLTHLALVPKVPSLPNTGDTPPELFTRAVRISTCSCLPIHPPILPILLPFIPFPIFPDFYPSPSFLTIYTTTTATTFSSYSPYRKISAPTASPGLFNAAFPCYTQRPLASSLKRGLSYFACGKFGECFNLSSLSSSPTMHRSASDGLASIDACS
jgi:hypothetical protein